jgi:hypothetical protein
MAPFDVDIDQEKVLCEGEWIGKMELVDRIRRMIETGDYRIGAAASALEYLQKTVSEVQEIRVRLLPDDLNRIEQGALQAGMTVGALLRQAVQAYLAGNPQLDEAVVPEPELSQPIETLTNETIIPGDDEQPVPLMQPKSQPISIPRLDAALPMSLESPSPASNWQNSKKKETVFQAHPATHGSPLVEEAWFKKG